MPDDTTSFSLVAPSGKTLHGVLHAANRPGRRPTVLICHGFKGFMEWGFFPHLAGLLAQRGITAVRFNFSGAGMKPGDELVTDLEAFRGATFSADRDELLVLLESLGREVGAGRVDPDRLALFGHSRGGGTALLAAAQPRWRERIRALVTWSAISTFFRYEAEVLEEMRRTGSIPVLNSRTGQELEVGVEVLEDLEENREALDLLAAAKRRRAPWLIVHGEDDESVPVEEARKLEAAAGGEVELEVIPDAGHTLGAQHPFKGPTPALIEALNATQRWFRRHL